jgi:hypothetical protein
MQVPIIEHGRSPALGYDKEIIDFCSEIGASIEIDLYVNNGVRFFQNNTS